MYKMEMDVGKPFKRKRVNSAWFSTRPLSQLGLRSTRPAQLGPFFAYLIKCDNIHFPMGGGLALWLASRTLDQGVPGLRPGRVPVQVRRTTIISPHTVELAALECLKNSHRLIMGKILLAP